MPRIATRLLVLFGCGIALHAQEPGVTFRGEERPPDAVATEAPDAAAAARKWLPLVRDAGYRLVLSDDRAVLLVLSPTFVRRVPKKEHHEVEVMLGLVRDTVAAAKPFAPPPTATLVILGMRHADYAKVLAQLVAAEPAVRDWAETAGKTVNGFILSRPLVAGFIEDPEGVDEWQLGNELVHRTAQLLVRSHAPQLPPWLMLGLGWHVEDTVCSSIYCFPHRTGFVTDAEHTDWGLCLANNFKASRRKKDGRPPTLAAEEFTEWRPEVGRDEFTSGRAYIAFGVARFVAQEQPGKLAALMQTLSDTIDKDGKEKLSETEWKWKADYLVPTTEQAKLLNGVADDFLTKVTDYFVKRKANERRAASKKH